jgi:LysR family transcriptional regulator, positive regulator for ilvC
VDLRDLRYFLHLSDTLHFARSSRELHVSPSGLTRAIQRLEQELEVNLLERDNRSVALTPAGVLLKEFARQSLGEYSRLRVSLQEQAEHLRGRLSLFCSVTASYSLLHDLLARFRHGFPSVELQLHTGDSAEALRRVVDNLDDLAIAALPDNLPPKLASFPLTESGFVCIGPTAASPVQQMLENVQSEDDVDWSALPVIMPETGLTRSRVEAWFSARGIKPRIYASVSGHEAMVSMASLGCGIAVVPQMVLDNSPMRDRLRILPLMSSLQPFTIALCAMQRKLSNPLIAAFWSIARQDPLAPGRSDYPPGSAGV